MKVYKANTILSLNVKVEGKCAHVSFDAMSNGESLFRTESEALQEALEKHKLYGKYFVALPDDTPADVAEEDQSEVVEDEGPVEVYVSSPNEAKDYLSDRFGISRTKLKSIAAIKNVAESNNVVFIGLDE